MKIEFTDFWKESIFNDNRKNGHKNKLRTYREFKIIFEMEPYLNIIDSYAERKSLSKFRVSNHNLIIEKGRHMIPTLPVEDRKCTECKVIGDECHMMTECKKNENMRVELYKDIVNTCKNFQMLSSKDKLIFMMSITDDYLIKKIGKFVHKSLNLEI